MQSYSASSPPSKPHPPVTRASGAVPRGSSYQEKPSVERLLLGNQSVQSHPYSLKMVGARSLSCGRKNTLDSFSIAFSSSAIFLRLLSCSPHLASLPSSACSLVSWLGRLWASLTCHYSVSQVAAKLSLQGHSKLLACQVSFLWPCCFRLSFPILS